MTRVGVALLKKKVDEKIEKEEEEEVEGEKDEEEGEGWTRS